MNRGSSIGADEPLATFHAAPNPAKVARHGHGHEHGASGDIPRDVFGVHRRLQLPGRHDIRQTDRTQPDRARQGPRGPTDGSALRWNNDYNGEGRGERERDLATLPDNDDDQDGLLAQADMRTDLVRPSGSAERDGAVTAELDQGHEFEHYGGSALQVPLRGSYGSTDIRRGRSGVS